MKTIFGGVEGLVVGILCLAGFVAGTCPSAFAEPTTHATYGDVYRMDTGFAIALENRGEIYAVLVAPDGGYYVGGFFTTIGGLKRSQFAKFKADGTIDAAFNTGIGFDGAVSAVALQPDGRIVVGGIFSHFDGMALNGIARLNTDGTLDTTFNPGAGFNNTVNSIAVQTDGRIVAGGRFTTFDGVACNYIAQLNADGSRDTTFSPGTGFNRAVNAVAIQPDGRIVVGGWFYEYKGVTQQSITRLNVDGTLDSGFDTGGALNGGVRALAIQPDGRIVAGGDFRSYYDDGSYRDSLSRLNADGTLDTTFNPDYPGFMGVHSVVVQSDGRIVVGGGVIPKFIPLSGTVLRFNTDGTIDSTFNSGADFDVKFDLPVKSVALLLDERIVAGGLFTRFDGELASGLALLASTGAADLLVTDCRRPGEGRIVPVAGGKFIVGGDFIFVNGVLRFSFARVNEDGSVDTTFNQGLGYENLVDSIKVQSDGRIVVGTFRSRPSLVRVTEDGMWDWSFDLSLETPPVKVLVILPDGRMLAAGPQWTWDTSPPASTIVRLNTDGSLDPTFSFGSKFMYGDTGGTIESVVLQADGRIVVGGHFDSFNGTARGGIVRLNMDGTLDPTFDPGTGVGGNGTGYSSLVSGLAMQPDGRIVVSGLFEKFNGVARKGIVRLRPDGSVDPTFKGGVDLHEFYTTLALQTDGRIIVGDSTTGVVRLEANGRLDRRFALPDVTTLGASEISFTTDGRLLLSSSGASLGGVSQIGVAVLKPEAGGGHHGHHGHDRPPRPHQKERGAKESHD